MTSESRRKTNSIVRSHSRFLGGCLQPGVYVFPKALL